MEYRRDLNLRVRKAHLADQLQLLNELSTVRISGEWVDVGSNYGGERWPRDDGEIRVLLAHRLQVRHRGIEKPDRLL